MLPSGSKITIIRLALFSMATSKTIWKWNSWGGSFSVRSLPATSAFIWLTNTTADRWSVAGPVASSAFALLEVSASALRLARSCSGEPSEHRPTPEQQRLTEEQTRPKLPGWAEDAKRRAEQAFEEVRREKQRQAATRPATRPASRPTTARGGAEEWQRDAGGQWRPL